MLDSADAPPARARHSKARRHHYVPEMILRRFAGPDLHLWSFDKRHPDYGIKRKPIARLFWEWHLYTSVEADGRRDRSAETDLSAMESRAGPVLDRIAKEARQGRLTRMQASEREAVAALLIAQMKRTPDYFAAFLAKWSRAVAGADGFAEWEAAGLPTTDEERADLTDALLVERERRNLLAQTAAQPMARTSAAMLERGILVGVLTAPNRSFLLGSAPFPRFQGHLTGRDGFADPTMEAWMPIARDVALCSYGEPRDERLVMIDDRGLRKINGAISRESTVIASASRELVASYARRFGRAPSAEG